MCVHTHSQGTEINSYAAPVLALLFQIYILYTTLYVLVCWYYVSMWMFPIPHWLTQLYLVSGVWEGYALLVLIIDSYTTPARKRVGE